MNTTNIEPIKPSESKKTKETFSGAICGGVVKESEFWKEPYGYMMSYIIPDKQFALYVKAKDSGDDKAANKIFDKYAWSAI